MVQSRWATAACSLLSMSCALDAPYCVCRGLMIPPWQPLSQVPIPRPRLRQQARRAALAEGGACRSPATIERFPGRALEPRSAPGVGRQRCTTPSRVPAESTVTPSMTNILTSPRLPPVAPHVAFVLPEAKRPGRPLYRGCRVSIPPRGIVPAGRGGRCPTARRT